MTRRSTESPASGAGFERRLRTADRSGGARRTWVATLLAGATAVALLGGSIRSGAAQPGGVEHPVGPEEACLDCHDDLLSAGTTLHSPAEEELCDVCHSVEGEADLYTVATPGGDQACLDCHESELKEAPEGGSLHGLLERDACVVCHDPHAGRHPKLLRAPINEVCLACHLQLTDQERAASPLEVDAATWDEAGKIFLGDDRTMGHPMLAHPVSGAAESSEATGPLTCLSCHAAHASSHPGLMLGGLEMCARCHS